MKRISWTEHVSNEAFYFKKKMIHIIRKKQLTVWGHVMRKEYFGIFDTHMRY